MAGLLVALAASCAGGDGGVSRETPRGIGPRAIDVDRDMAMVLDSIATDGDDIFVRVRVVNLNGSDWLDVGADDTFYAPLLVLRDDLGSTYPARAVEPAGVYDRSIGRFELRLDGPLDSNATELSAELATQRGPLATGTFDAPSGDAVRWWTEAPPVSFSDLSATDPDGRTLAVVGLVDRGTHIEVSVRASDQLSTLSTADLGATLTLADGTELTALPHDPAALPPSRTVVGVLSFPGALPTGATTVTLHFAGLEIEIPVPDLSSLSSTAPGPALADTPRLPDLIDAKIFNDPLPTSTLTPDEDAPGGG